MLRRRANRIHLAKMLRRGGNLILLDEPTNDLDVNTMRVLEQALVEFPGCAVVTSHDRFFLYRVCTHLLIMEATAARAGSRGISPPTRSRWWRRTPCPSPTGEASIAG